MIYEAVVVVCRDMCHTCNLKYCRKYSHSFLYNKIGRIDLRAGHRMAILQTTVGRRLMTPQWEHDVGSMGPFPYEHRPISGRKPAGRRPGATWSLILMVTIGWDIVRCPCDCRPGILRCPSDAKNSPQPFLHGTLMRRHRQHGRRRDIARAPADLWPWHIRHATNSHYHHGAGLLIDVEHMRWGI